MENNECKLEMNDLFISKCDFSQTREDSDTNYNVSFQIEYAVNNDNPSRFKITILTSVKNKTESMRVNLETVGIFTIDRNEIGEELSENLIKVNTVAIMFPFIRSQISLLTTQPGLTPVLLPPINVSTLIDSGTEEEL